MRTALSVLLALAAAVAASAAVVLALTAVVVADPDRPGRLGALALSSPGLRDDATDYLVDALREQGLAAGADQRQIDRVTEQAVADPAVREALAELEVDERGEVRLDGVVAAVADRLEEQGRDREAQRLRDLPPESVTSGAVGDRLGDVARTARLGLTVAALVAGAVALVVGGLALVAARRTLLCFGGIVLLTGLLSAVGLEVAPALAGESGAAGAEWLGAARGLDEVLGSAGTITVVTLLVLGGLLALLGLRSGRGRSEAG